MTKCEKCGNYVLYKRKCPECGGLMTEAPRSDGWRRE